MDRAARERECPACAEYRQQVAQRRGKGKIALGQVHSALKSDYEHGLSLRGIAQKYNSDHKTVMQYIQDTGIERKSSTKYALDRVLLPLRREVLHDFHAGMGYKNLAEKYGASESGMWKWIQRQGVKRKSGKKAWKSIGKGNVSGIRERNVHH
jgi:uncharacterized protein YjcR